MGCGSSKNADTAKDVTPAPKPPPKRKSVIVQPAGQRPSSVELSSECIHIETDPGEDGNQIDVVEKGYPDASPSDISTHNNRPAHHWFEDESFQNGSDEVIEIEDVIRQIKTEKGDDDAGIDIFLAVINGALSHRGPTPAIKKKPKISFREIDSHAKQADPGLLDSFKKLVSYLTQAIPHGDKNKELLTARAIVMWLSQQNIDGADGEANLTSPRGLLSYLKEERMTYATCYTILCREAKLMCTLVNGLVKAADYQPGDTEAPSFPWTAVYVDGSWQIVHPFWICKALYGHKLGGWIKIEKDGSNLAEKEVTQSGIIKNTFQEYYFIPRPEEFIHLCYATDTPWQLLPAATTVKSKEDFFELPYLLPPFFDLGLELTSKKSCVLEAKDGRCKIEFKAKRSNAHMLVLQYELFVQETSEENNNFGNEILSRMVFNSRSSEDFVFDIRFPIEGTFKLVIYGGPHKSTALRACEFKLVCKQRMKGCNLLPLGCGDIGWGPSPTTADEGLVVPSRPNGFIAVSKNIKKGKIDISFQMKDDFMAKMVFIARLYAEVDGQKKGFEKYIKTRVNKKDKTLNIAVRLPSNGEYGVSVVSKPRTEHGPETLPEKTETGSRNILVETEAVESNDVHLYTESNNFQLRKEEASTHFDTDTSSSDVPEKTLCNYLLSTGAPPKREKPSVRLAKQKMHKALASDKPLPKKIEEINERIVDCKKEAGKTWRSDDDIRAAQTRLEFLVYKNSLREAHLRRNLAVTRRTLKLVNNYRHKEALLSEIRETEELEQELANLHGHSRTVPKLEKAYQEIVTLVRVSDEVHTTFRALCLLLGEEDIHLDHWFNIQAIIRESTHSQRDRVFTRMKRFREDEIRADQKERVVALLKTCDEERVRKSNTSAHSFYVWIQKMVGEREEDPKPTDT